MNSPFTDFIEVFSETFKAPDSNIEVKGPFSEIESYDTHNFSNIDSFEPGIVTENELQGDDLTRAIQLNAKYSGEYGWRNYIPQILNLIGAQSLVFSFDPTTFAAKFAQAFADWQDRNGYKTTLKGVLGLNNWTYFQKNLGFHNLSNQFHIDVEKAITANKKYASSWDYAKSEIFQYLNKGLPLNDEYFAYMIAKYQNDINLGFNNNIKVDGILGRTTWDILRTHIEKANPSFDIKQHIKMKDYKGAAERYVEELIKYSALMINALTKIQDDINTYIRNEPIEFDTGGEIIYGIANSIVGAIPIVGATGNALLDINKEYWKNIRENIDRQFEKERSLKLTDLVYILKNQLINQDSKVVIQHSLQDKVEHSGKIGDQIFTDFTKEIDRIARLNKVPDEIMKVAFSNLVASFSSHTRIYVHCQNTTDFKNWGDQDIINLLNDGGRKRLNIRFTRVHPQITATENYLTPTAIKNLTTLWELAKRYHYSLKDIKVKKDVFFRINLPLSLSFGPMSSSYILQLSFYLKTLLPNENWSPVVSILDLPFNKFRLPNNEISYKDKHNSISRHLLSRNDKGLEYQDIILRIANSVMGSEYGLPVADQHIGLISTETEVSETSLVEGIMGETIWNAEIPCEGRNCWAKKVLNKLLGLNLSINNTIDEATSQAIADFQSKNNIPQSQKIDAVTERVLLEADAIQRQGTAVSSIIASAKTKIEDWTTGGLSGVKTKPQHILNSFRDPRKLWAFVLHQMAFKRRGGTNRQYSAPEGYVNTGSHFCIMLDGRIIQLHPVSRMIWHGNCVSPRSVAVEFEGNFPNIKGSWWFDRKKYRKSPDEDQPTQAQYDSGRFLASYLKIVLGTTHILAHRQSSDSRENDPGPDIWYNVGQWAIDNLGLTDGGPSFKCGTGNPILPEWRTWGNKTSTLISKEYNEPEEEVDWEDVENEAMEYNYETEEAESEDFFFEALENEETEDIETEYDSFYETEEFVNDWSKAVRLNRFYSEQLGWKNYHEKINDFLLPFSGQQNVSLSEESFAQAVAEWQQQQGLSADGVIGPDTWAKMKTSLVPGSVNPPQLPVPVASTSITGNIPSLGTLGKLMINTSVPALSKSYPEYQFTSEDAIWLARFVEGEAGGQDDPDSHAVIWAMFNRFGMLRHRVSTWTSFAVFLQKYSTTLQPLLNSRGAAERVWMNNKSNPAKNPVVSSNDSYPGTSVKKVQYQRHIDLQKKTWTAFPEYVRNMILRILTGQIPNPGIGIATDFDSTYVFLNVARRKQGISGEPSYEEWKQYTIEHAKTKKVIWIGEKANLNQKKNAFYIQSYLKDVPNDAVRIVTSQESEMMYTENYDSQDYFTENITQDLSNAIRQNQAFGNKLGWNQYHDQINDFLLPYSEQQNVSLGEEAFAHAVAAWQLQQGLTADGIIGPNTWNKMKPLLNQISQPPAPSVTTDKPAPSLQNIFDFNKWHAQKILDSINAGILGVNNFLRFNPKSQLEMILKGQQVLKVNPHTDIIQIFPFIYHICEQARLNNYTEIIIGSFIRDSKPDGSCTGHCKGRCIDINFKNGNFGSTGAVQMVVNIFNYLLGLPAEFKKGLGFGLPLQGGFFGNKQLTKFKGTSVSNLNDSRLRQLIPQLGIVFPDNDNHLHIQCNWMPANGKKKSETDHESDFEDTMNIEEESMEAPAFENFSLSTRLDKIRDWLHLLLFKVPDNIFAGLRWRNMYVQYAHNESYSNDLNVDFYRLRIYRYPTVNGILFDATSLLKYIRININSLVDTSYCDFYPYNNTIDTPAWRSDDPIGAVLKLNIKGPDNASVVVSLSKPNGWRFTTVHTPDTGDHPVSGQREFFIGKDSETGGTYFIIKGLDMMSTGIAGLGLPLMGLWGFSQADALWKSMRSKVIQFINTNGGYAKEDMTYSERVEWRYVYHRYKDLLAETFGKGAGSAANSSFFDFQLESEGNLSGHI